MRPGRRAWLLLVALVCGADGADGQRVRAAPATNGAGLVWVVHDLRAAQPHVEGGGAEAGVWRLEAQGAWPTAQTDDPAHRGPGAVPIPRVQVLAQRAGTTLRWGISPGQNAYFAFSAVAGEGRCRPTARVMVAPVTADGSSAASTRLWSGAVRPLTWPPAAETIVDLARWSGQRVRLFLEVRRGAHDEPRCEVQWQSPTLAWQQPGQPAVSAALPNILLVGVDTLRADTLGAWGRRPSLTPALDALAAESDVWLQAHATANSTNPSFASIHTGLFPAHHGVHDLSTPLPPSATTLAERLSAAGYDTAAIVAIGHLNGAPSGLGQGFARYVDTAVNVAAPVVLDEALRLVGRAAARPWFLWVHLYDVHTPHMPPAPFALGRRAAQVFGLAPVAAWTAFRPLGPRGFREPSLGGQRDLYDGEVAYVDRQLDRLFGALRERGVLDRTLVAFVADHGENLDEHGMHFRHAGLWDSTTHVPLMIRWPRAAGAPRPAGRRIRGVVQTIDLYPTLLAAARLRPNVQDGADLRALTRAGGRAAAYSEQEDGKGGAVRTGRWRYFLSRGSTLVPDGTYLYDDAVDPGETHNLAGRGLREEAELRALLGDWMQRGVVAPPRPLSAEEAAALRALGY